MKQKPARELFIILSCGLLLAFPLGIMNPLLTGKARAQAYSSGGLLSSEQLDNLLAPIALYPDPLLAQVLLASTYVDQIDEAARWMRAYNAVYAIDSQPWDVSVKAVAHYPSVLYMMSDWIDWTTAVGQAYIYQPADVMASVQRLRALAYNAGNLVTNQYQQVIVEGGYIRIVPAQPRYIYVPAYDPNIVYLRPASYFAPLYPSGIIFFGPGFLIGAWLNYDCDWRAHRIYYHGWRGTGWIARSRPLIHVTNVYVNNRYRNVQINRNVVRRHVNYYNLNRYNAVHRGVNFTDLSPGRGGGAARPDTGNKIIRRNLDVADPRIDVYRGHQRVQPPRRRESRPSSPPGLTRPAPSPRREAGPSLPPAVTRPAPPSKREKAPPPAQARPRREPTPPREAPPVARPAPEQPSREAQGGSPSVFGPERGGFDPRTASERGRASREQENRRDRRPEVTAPRPQGGRPEGRGRERRR